MYCEGLIIDFIDMLMMLFLCVREIILQDLYFNLLFLVINFFVVLLNMFNEDVRMVLVCVLYVEFEYDIFNLSCFFNLVWGLKEDCLLDGFNW